LLYASLSILWFTVHLTNIFHGKFFTVLEIHNSSSWSQIRLINFLSRNLINKVIIISYNQENKLKVPQYSSINLIIRLIIKIKRLQKSKIRIV